MLALTFSGNAQVWSDEPYRDLWAKAEAAITEGKPQTAVGYLSDLEKVCQKRKDDLALYKVMRTKYDCLCKYNWKEANKYYPQFTALQRKLFDNLDTNIELYANHPAVDALINEKISRLKRDADMARDRNGKRYREVRKVCMKAAEVFPKSEYRKEWISLVNSMDSKNVGIGSEKSFIYPGETLEFELSGRNIDESEFAVYRLNDRYQIVGSEPLKKISGNARLVSKQRMTEYKGEYNIPERIKTDFCFGDPGIYVVANSAAGLSEYNLIYVSRVALATRQTDGKNEVYVAEAKTGKPYENATIYAWSDYFEDENIKDGFVRPGYISQKEYQLAGFTPLTQQIFSKNQYSAMIVADAGGDKWSPAVNISEADNGVRKGRGTETLHYIYTDRTLYRAGDTVQFKIIALSTDYEKGKVLSGKKINVSLYAPTSDKPAAKLALTTNSMGSAAGSFVIPTGAKNGSWRLSSDRGGTSFNVEAYKDPKYKLELDNIQEIYKCGDAVIQIGRVKGYTGEGIAGARVEYTVEALPYYWSNKNKIIAEGETRTDTDGFFEIPFTTVEPENSDSKTALHRINVKAVAPGGETCENGKMLTAAREPLQLTPKFDVEYRMDTLLLVNKAKAQTLTISARNFDGEDQPIEGWYKLSLKGRVRSEGKMKFGDPVVIDFSELPSGEYQLEYGAETPAGSQQESSSVALLSPDDTACPVKREMFFYPVVEKDAIDFMVGTSEDDLYLELEVFDGGKVVYRKPLRLRSGAQHIKLDYKAAWNDQVTVSLYGIKDMKVIQNSHNFSREVSSNNFEIKVSSLRDRTTPNTTETFTVEAPQSEMLISIYDSTCDRYRKNNFYFSPIYPYHSSAPYIWSNLGGYHHFVRGGRPMLMAKQATRAAGVMVEEEAMVMNDAVMAPESAMDFGAAMDEADIPSPDQIDIREDFSQTLAFIPQLAIPASGKSTVSFTTRDGLSSFRIAMLAHTKDLKSGTAERQIVVSKAVKIESFAPLFAIEGDRLVVKANVANTGIETVKGRASLRLTDEDDLELDIYTKDIDMTLKPGASQTASWEIEIPEGVKKIGVTSVFASAKASDAEKRQIEVMPAARYITEAESFVIGSGRNKNSCIRDLKARFPYPDAVIRYEEYSTKDALKEVLTKPQTPRGDNMIEWLDALYVNQMRGILLGVDSVDVKFSRKAAAKLGSLQKADGGFGWFPCCSSSDLLTLMFLDKTYYLREVGALPRNTTINKQIEKALAYVDKRVEEITKAKKWDWRDLTYFFAARMEHPNIAMNANSQKMLTEYLKRCKKDGWQDLPIVEKAKLCTVLESTGELKQMFAVMNSLRDYAVRNDNVGCYFPNAVMPFRGLLHTEIYAHSLLAVVFAEMDQMDIAKGIMKWLLLQKHNQEWKSNMASADAIFALLKYRAPDLKFGAVYYTYKAPMLSVKESANQLSVKRSYWRGGKQLKDGQRLRVGDKIDVHYDIYNTENRSFVVMEASRPACFYPKDERSYGSYWFYCERLTDRTKYYFQTLAEENTSIQETFYVTQEGTFNSAWVTIESLYAPEYRGHTGAFKVEAEE